MRDIIKSIFKKTKILSLSAILLALFLCGCTPPTAPKESTLQWPKVTATTPQAAGVVTILSSGRVNTGTDRYLTTKAYSGILLNNEGFILTSWQVCNFDVTDGGKTYSGEMTQTYAVLADLYGDDTHYSLTLIDEDEGAGLALFQLKTKFSYKIEQGGTKEGFPFVPKFSPYAPQTGNQCYAIGNSLGELLVNNTFFHTSYQNLKLSVTKGIVSRSEIPQDTLPPYTLGSEQCLPTTISAPVSPEMVGGGVFDENGYLMGLVTSKLLSESEGETTMMTRMSLLLPGSWLMHYIDTVSEQKEIVIPYTYAKAQEDAA